MLATVFASFVCMTLIVSGQESGESQKHSGLVYLARRFDQLNEKTNSLQLQIKDGQNKVAALQEKDRELMSKITELKTGNEKLGSTTKDLQKKDNALQEKDRQLMSKITGLQTDNYRLRSTTNELKRKLSKSQCQSGKVTFTQPYYTKTVVFRKEFERVPALTTGLVMLDSYADRNLRVLCTANHVTTTSFQIKCDKWHDTILYIATISWMAC